MKITIKNKNYQVVFGFGAFKILCKKWNEKTLTGLGKHLTKIEFKEGEEPTLDQYDLIGQLALAGVENANKDVSFTSDDLVDALFQNPSKIKELIETFVASYPKPSEANPEKRGN